jgi:ribonuclease HII
MGYGAKRHLQAIAEHGPCPLHRMTFRPMRKA